MGRTFVIAAAILAVTASWACAGPFEALPQAGILQPPTPLRIQPGAVVKADFKSNMKTESDMEMDSDGLLPEPVSSQDTPQIKARPAVAFKEKSKGMAPPQKAAPKPEPAVDTTKATKDESTDLDDDLEKNLVISPKPDAKPEVEHKASQERQPVHERKSVTEGRAEKTKAAGIKKVKPQAGTYVASPKPIQKVKPVTQNPWYYPAGTYQADSGNPSGRVCPMPECVSQDGQRVSNSNPRSNSRNYQNNFPNYGAQRPVQPPQADRFVRDGVTIRLAPAAAAQPPAYGPEEESSGSDIFSTAAEIIGMPFAFISSFF